MIDKALFILAKDLNQQFRRISNQPTDTVVLSTIIKQDGTLPDNTGNRVICSVINIEQETTFRNQSENRKAQENTVQASVPIYLHVHVLFTANYTDYLSGLASLSTIIGYLQDKQVFNHQNTPQLDPGIEKLIFDMTTLDFSDLSHLWGGLGAKYMPSAVYRMRMLGLAGSQVQNIRKSISETGILT